MSCLKYTTTRGASERRFKVVLGAQHVCLARGPQLAAVSERENASSFPVASESCLLVLGSSRQQTKGPFCICDLTKNSIP